MLPDSRFTNLPKSFWANVRTVSQELGYTDRTTNQIKIPSLQDIKTAMNSLRLNTAHLSDINETPTEIGTKLTEYFKYRAHILNNFVQRRLTDVTRAKEIFEGLKAQFDPACPIPMNKQKGDKKAPAYLTGVVNMLIEANCQGMPCNYAPGRLTTFTRDGAPLRTLARRVDGCFPDTFNPIAIWEVKEYYYTTTFGSRVADGIYETLLDGLELEELREREGIDVYHLLVVDSHYTWWVCGRSYLCRIVDMLHMGYVDEVLFGDEVLERLPIIVKDWVQKAGMTPDSPTLPELSGP